MGKLSTVDHAAADTTATYAEPSELGQQPQSSTPASPPGTSSRQWAWLQGSACSSLTRSSRVDAALQSHCARLTCSRCVHTDVSMLLQGKHMEPSSDLASVLRTCLLPQLCLKHLQSLALTCRALKCLVLAASVPTWTLAAARQSLPTVCISAADPYSSITEVAAQQMAIAAGQGSEAARMHGGSAALQLREPMLLHPAFAEVAHCSPHSSNFCIK